jgi:flap endonuclease-1
MGVNLKPLTSPETISLDGLKGKAIAIDAYNALHQFLSIIRQRDGTLLKDASGEVTSHLAGLLYRTSNLVEKGIKPIYVFDGKPHPLKMDTLNGRKAIKEKAMEEWEKARERGDMEEARKKAQQTSVLSKEMVEEAKKLLDGLGIPYVQAPGEGEAQASFMCMKGDADAVSSQDFDCLLFGAPVLVRNVAITGKRKMPGKQKWVNISPERIILEDVFSTHGITREQLVDIAILVGTDFNKGVKGIGPKTALKLIKKYGSIEGVAEAEGIALENVDEVRDIFLHPSVTEDYSIEWEAVDEEEVINFLCGEHQFGKERVRHAVEKFRAFSKLLGQKNLFDF